MKKLMVILAAVVMAVGVQAASVDWSVAITGQGVAWSANGAYVMAFNGSDYDVVISLLTETGSENMATDLGGYALKKGTESQFAISSNRGTAKAAGSSSNLTGDTMFWVVFTGGSMDANKSIAWTAATDISAFDYEAGSPSPGTLSVTAVPNTGTIADVPEPTSGILFIVGSALLALRRKQK